ncbi:hypothetical protein BUE80_DR010531 [Diplocarpon rosae]|nr:hypothetical protein BUE80_DR010531 [Diplocarpon rosae]
MLPTSLLALTASFIAPVIAASSPSCVASSDSTGYASQKLLYLYNDFCDELSAASFGTKQKLYDSPVILAMNFNVASARDCSLASCLISFKSLVDRCQKDDKSIWGTGSITDSCGVFSFDVWPPSAAASLGVPGATLTVATMTTYDIARLTATSSSSSSSTSSSTVPLPSYPASTNETSSSTTTSQTPFAKTWVASTYLFANSTSSTRFVNATSTGSPIASATKPVGGPSTLGTSGAEMIRVGGLSLVVVATIFGFFL